MTPQADGSPGMAASAPSRRSVELWTSARPWASLALFLSPVYLFPLFPLTPIVLVAVTLLLGHAVWPGRTRMGSLALGAVAAVALTAAAVIVFFLYSLCGPDSLLTLVLGFSVAAATYTAGCYLAIRRPWTWPLSMVAAAIAFDAVLLISLWSGVEWIC